MMSLLHVLGPEKVPAGQVIFAASDREQAGIGFREAAEIVRCAVRPSVHRVWRGATLLGFYIYYASFIIVWGWTCACVESMHQCVGIE